MDYLGYEVMCLRFFGDDLDPRQLSRQLGVDATHGWRKGELWSNNGVGDLRETGGWILNGDWFRHPDMDAQITELFESLSSDLRLWARLSTLFYAEVFCGLFLVETNGQAMLSPRSMKLLGARELTLNMEIYEREDARARLPKDWGTRPI
jgi:hypothetical protein